MEEQKNITDLMLKAKTGDRDAFGLVYSAYFKPIYRYIYARIKNKGETEDIAQTVFLKAFGGLRNFRDQKKSPLAYFFTIARNTVINHERKKNPFLLEGEIEELEIRDDKADQQQEYEEKEHKKKILKVVSLLNGQQKKIITLKFFDQLSNQEISSFMNKKEDAIRQLQCRAIKKMREIMNKEFPKI